MKMVLLFIRAMTEHSYNYNLGNQNDTSKLK